jgi:hypothetical protein
VRCSSCAWAAFGWSLSLGILPAPTNYMKQSEAGAHSLHVLIRNEPTPAPARWATSAERAERGPQQWRESTLFFGLSRQDANGTGGQEISDADFYRFVSDVVTPLFPDGLTVLDAHG